MTDDTTLFIIPKKLSSYQNYGGHNKTQTITDPIQPCRHNQDDVRSTFVKRPSLSVLRWGVMAALVVVMAFVLYDASSSSSFSSSSSGQPHEKLMIRSPLWGSSHKHHHHKHHHDKHHKTSSSSSSKQDDNENDTLIKTMKKIPMPHGVNLGSWLSLEDYFYVGDNGAVEVATPDENTAAVCLPPLHLGQVGAPDWQSETDLLKE